MLRTNMQVESALKHVVREIPYLLLAAPVLLLDQVTKNLVQTHMALGQSIPPEGILRLTYVVNTGSAFGLFPNQQFFLTIASFAGVGLLLYFYVRYHVQSVLLRISISMQLGGAIGNLMDRMRLGHVRDFIDFGIWPVFNLGDSFIILGICLMLFFLFSRYREDRKQAHSA